MNLAPVVLLSIEAWVSYKKSQRICTCTIMHAFTSANWSLHLPPNKFTTWQIYTKLKKKKNPISHDFIVVIYINCTYISTLLSLWSALIVLRTENKE